GIRPVARDHHRRHQVRVRTGQQGRTDPDRRGADARFLALLAGGSVPSRVEPAELRQAVRARLPGGERLEQATPGAVAAAGGGREDRGEVSRSPGPADGRKLKRLPPATGYGWAGRGGRR